MTHNLENYLEVACGLTKEVGQIIRNKIWVDKQSVVTKEHKHDFVTETDQEVEKLLITGLSAQFPDHKFIGEETTSSGVKSEFTDDPTWIIDPVDGTLNFVHGYPNVCVSIGLTIGKELVVGIIYVPVPDLLFTAIKGQGAFLNGKQIHVSKAKDLSDSLLVLELSGGASDEQRRAAYVHYVTSFLPQVHGIRSSGSAAYNMATVALGAGDCYFEIGIHAWDMAAGAIIVREAGGVVLDTLGGELDLMSRRVLCAATPELAKQVVPYIKQTSPARDD